MIRHYVGMGMVAGIGLLALPGCTSHCGDDGLVWQQADQPACMQVAETETATTGDDTTGEPTTDTPTTGTPGGMYCKDADGDGFGDPTMCSDEMTPGSVDNDDDCADDNPNAYPGAAEKDSTTACMEDADEDGFGDDMPPPGVEPGTDCNDDESSIFPDAAIDLPGVCAQDSDGDGHGDSTPTDPEVPPGDDCADDDPNTFPGAAPNDSPDACMTDVDGDDWGDETPAPGVTPGTDCADDNANAFPGAAEKEDMQCKEDEDMDGYGDDMPPGGVVPGEDCDDADVNTGPGFAENESDPTLCRSDADMDGYGDDTPTDPDAVPGTDCNDESPFTFPGSAPNDSPEACMADEDDDDWGDSNPEPNVVPGTDCDDTNASIHVNCVNCTPGEAVCEGDELHVCNDDGLSEEITDCEFGCDDVEGKCYDPLEVDAGNSICVDIGMPAQLNAVAMGGDGMYNYSWTPIETLDDPAKADPIAMPLGPTTYTIDVSDGLGNMASDKVSVYLKGQALNLDPNICTTYDFPYEADPATKWVWNNNTKELCQTVNGKGSALFCGWDLDNATISGTFAVKTTDDDDFTGFMWGLQDTSHFYIFTWKQLGQNFNACGGALPGGMQVKVVDVLDADKDPLACADLHVPADTVNSKLLVGVDDFTTMGWKDNTEYLFELTHKAGGEMTIVVKEKANMAVVAEKTFMDTTYPSGKFGMYTKSQISSCFSNFTASCI